jgi:hypothetical protein
MKLRAQREGASVATMRRRCEEVRESNEHAVARLCK